MANPIQVTAAGLSRRTVAGGLAGLFAASGVNAAGTTSRPTPTPRFLWGTAISGHQSEGNNVNSDAWYLENHTPSAFTEPSGDACDSYHRYEQDLDIAAKLGLNCYRLGIE